MQPLSFTRKLIDENLVTEAVDILVSSIVASGDIISIYLFGSASEHKMTNQSDIDLLIVVPNVKEMRVAQQKLRRIQSLTDFAVDLVWVDKVRFERMKDLGGVCMIAYQDGQRIYPKVD